MTTPRGPSILTYHQRETLFIKLTTDTGLVGWGETYRLAGVEAAIRDVLAPLLVGRDPLDARALHSEMLAATFDNGFAVGGVDLALHDLWGKALGVPVHALYGGAQRAHAVQAYASLPGYFDDRRPGGPLGRRSASRSGRDGFRAMKFRIGRFARGSRDCRSWPRCARPWVQTCGCMADANAAYSPALRAARWPTRCASWTSAGWRSRCRRTAIAAIRSCARRCGCRWPAVKALTTRAAAHELLRRGCFDIIQPDVSICGGIAECLFIGELARLSQVQCIPHCWAGAIMLAATLQVVCAVAGAEPHARASTRRRSSST